MVHVDLSDASYQSIVAFLIREFDHTALISFRHFAHLTNDFAHLACVTVDPVGRECTVLLVKFQVFDVNFDDLVVSLVVALPVAGLGVKQFNRYLHVVAIDVFASTTDHISTRRKGKWHFEVTAFALAHPIAWVCKTHRILQIEGVGTQALIDDRHPFFVVVHDGLDHLHVLCHLQAFVITESQHVILQSKHRRSLICTIVQLNLGRRSQVLQP